MNLKEFVSETLMQIVEGVKEAQTKSMSCGGKVNPPFWHNSENLAMQKILVADGGDPVQFIDFDVALTVAEGTETKGGIGVFSGVIGLGSQGKSNAENASISRIKFNVPVVLPKFKKVTEADIKM